MTQLAVDHTTALEELAHALRQLEAQTSSLDRLLAETQGELHETRETHEVERNRQAEEESSASAKLHAFNKQLEGQFCNTLQLQDALSVLAGCFHVDHLLHDPLTR